MRNFPVKFLYLNKIIKIVSSFNVVLLDVVAMADEEEVAVIALALVVLVKLSHLAQTRQHADTFHFYS